MTGAGWSHVRERLARLAAAPDADKVFGSGSHRWQLGPPLRAEELAEVEEQLGVGLPADYRSFLLEAGRGGAGPAYGLFPLDRVDGRWRWGGDGVDLTDLDTLAQPFPHTAAFNPADGFPGPPEEEGYDSEEAFNLAEFDYWDRYSAVVERPEHSIGLLYLCHLGCAYWEALVISGPARGQMWADDTAGGGGFRPLHDDDGTPIGFARWYRNWLEGATADVSAR